jgi:hypothetical protein
MEFFQLPIRIVAKLFAMMVGLKKIQMLHATNYMDEEFMLLVLQPVKNVTTLHSG